MQFAQFELLEGLTLSSHEVGRQLLEELEQIGYLVSLPTAADWGFVFRTKSNGQTVDISVVSIGEQKFKLAVEPEKSLFATLLYDGTEFDSKQLIAFIEEILTSDVDAQYVKWYSTDNWKSTLGQDFWS